MEKLENGNIIVGDVEYLPTEYKSKNTCNNCDLHFSCYEKNNEELFNYCYYNNPNKNYKIKQ